MLQLVRLGFEQTSRQLAAHGLGSTAARKDKDKGSEAGSTQPAAPHSAGLLPPYFTRDPHSQAGARHRWVTAPTVTALSLEKEPAKLADALAVARSSACF